VFQAHKRYSRPGETRSRTRGPHCRRLTTLCA
jgi:hypothetical protein